jgi:ABC-type transport system involved in multi-copper enzyme maturation permease subunit
MNKKYQPLIIIGIVLLALFLLSANSANLFQKFAVNSGNGYTEVTTSKTGLAWLWGFVSNTGTTKTVQTANTNSVTCSWYQTEVAAQSKDNGLFYWRAIVGNPVITTTKSCKIADLTYVLIGAVVLIIIVIASRGRRRR